MMNRVTIVGRLTKDPELRYTPNGVAVAQFTLAVNRSYTNQQGDREADFIQCVVWRKPAENAANFLKKGSLAGVDGRLQTRNYEGNDGKRVYVTEVVAESVHFLDSKEKNGNSSNSQQSQQSQRQNQQHQNPYSKNTYNAVDDDPFKDNGLPIDINDDDLPF